MANVLEKIVADTRIRIDELKQVKPLSSFKDDLKPSERCLYESMAKKDAGFILECKKASPSKGLIRDVFNIDEIAGTYRKYAAGISVLTDEKYFLGKYEYLEQVTRNATCPVLNKDFFVDTYQVYLARYYGADAILLMLSVLSDEEYKELATVADSLKLSILTEISNDEERERAVALGAKLIGINNRNLRDLSTDINRTFELVKDIPEDRLVISESGIYTNKQVRTLAPVVNGFLVGSSLMAEDDLDLACRKLIFGENKVCGLTSVSAAKMVSQAGAAFGGLIFAPKSPRCVTEETAKDIVNSQPNLDYVGVFVDQDISYISALADTLNLAVVQLHGQEDNNYVSKLKEKLSPQCKIWKAHGVIDTLPAFDLPVEGYLLDGKTGGSGEPFDWQLLGKDNELPENVMLAGGLSIENIDDAIATLNRHQLKGLDINSGVESEPGVKNQEKLTAVFSAIRHY